jgi:hypothetical protein
MALANLIDLDRARQSIPTSQDADEPTISTFITAASNAIRRYCRRDFVQQTYDELYNGYGQRHLFLRQFPLLSVQSVRYRPVTVLKITNNLANTPQARVTVTNVGLTLNWVTNGVAQTDTSSLFATYPTIVALQNYLNSFGNGWSAVGQGYDAWPSADIYCPNGVSGSAGTVPATQGALTAAGQFAELKMHTYELAGFQINQRGGWLLRAIPYTDPELLHPEDLVWPTGINNFRVQYTAGFANIPDEVQEACAELVATWFVQRGRDLSFSHEALSGSYSFSIEAAKGQLPDRIRALLAQYRTHPVMSYGG